MNYVAASALTFPLHVKKSVYTSSSQKKLATVPCPPATEFPSAFFPISVGILIFQVQLHCPKVPLYMISRTGALWDFWLLDLEMCHTTFWITDLQLMEAWIIEFFWFSDHQGSVISAATVPGFKTGITGSLLIFPRYKCILSNRFDSFYQKQAFHLWFH